MILKPFMLRRVKKDVANEMPPKVELKVNCFLSQTQKYFYSSLHNHVATRELTGGQESLLNLVMQFRYRLTPFRC
jgi:SNF2 family DNA or RNA helicase